jgi:hypothetical protein
MLAAYVSWGHLTLFLAAHLNAVEMSSHLAWVPYFLTLMQKGKKFPKNVSLLKIFCGGISSFLLKGSRYISLICKEVFFLKVILSTFYESK